MNNKNNDQLQAEKDDSDMEPDQANKDIELHGNSNAVNPTQVQLSS